VNRVHQTPIRLDQKPDPKLIPNTTTASDESSFLQQQKKSLEVITEKSEFSNTTYARPGSYRSKQQMSSQKNGSMRGAAQREINGSVASLNNSSMINSSRNHVGKNLQPVKSLADISDDDPGTNRRKKNAARMAAQSIPFD
jgi:hypothetical protein